MDGNILIKMYGRLPYNDAMTEANRRERIEMRVNAETKLLAERASAALGCASLTEYLTRLIHDNAPEVVSAQAGIVVSSECFDRFVAVCDETEQRPSARIEQAAERLDREGL